MASMASMRASTSDELVRGQGSGAVVWVCERGKAKAQREGGRQEEEGRAHIFILYGDADIVYE